MTDSVLTALLRQQASLEIHQLAHSLRDENQHRLWRFVDRVTRRLSDDDAMDVMVEEFLLELKADRVAYVAADSAADFAADETEAGCTFAVSHEAADKGVKRLPLPYVIDASQSEDFHEFLESSLRHPGPEVRAWANPVKIQPEPRFDEALREEFQSALEEEFGLARFVSCHSAMACGVELSDGARALFCVQRLSNRTPWTRFQRELFGEMCRYAASLLDQTRLSEQVRELQDQFSSLIESMPSAIVGMDLLGTVAMWNGKAADIFGAAEAEALGRVFWELVPEFQFVEEGMGRILQMDPGASLDFELKPYRRRDGKSRFLRSSLFTLFGSDRGEVALRIDDVTGAEELRQKLSLSQRRELQAALLEVSGQELQNFLTAVQGRVWLLEQSLRDRLDATQQSEFAGLKSVTQQAAAALGRVLAMSGESSRDAESFEFRQVVREAVELFQKTSGPSVTFLYRDVADESTALFANRHQVEQALLNLFLHAHAGIRPGGAMVSRLHPGPQHSGSIWVELQLDAKGGAETLPSQPGLVSTSLGWTMTRALAEECGGRAEESALEDGTHRYRLAFPLHPEAERSGVVKTHPVTGEGKVLVVQSESSLRETTQRLLQKLGYAAEACRDGASAVARLESGTAFDLVILDWDLPVMNGRDTLAVLRGMRPKSRFLLLGVPAKASRQGLTAGVSLLPRAYRIEQFAQAVRDAVADLYLPEWLSLKKKKI